ncbi:MAG: glycosyltransferase family 9 protein [Bacteroidetes bacterium]|nr:glycosyltransferase family 9 protein [Bacteroidota bacterium]
MNKILIIRFSSLGDIILSFPLINALKKEYPKAEIHFLTKSVYKGILELNPKISKIIEFNNEPLSIVREKIVKEGYDLVLDIHKKFRSILLTKFSGLNVRRYKKDTFKKFLLVKFKINLFKTVIPVYLKYIKSAGKNFSEKYFTFSASELTFPKEKNHNFNYVVAAPSSRHFTKTFPKEKFAGVLNSLKVKAILIGDNSARDLEICTHIEKETGAVNLCGKLSFQELANLLHHSELVLTNDSAIMHFAEALGKKVCVFFGSTVKEFGFFPQLSTSKVYENKDLKCRPCTHIGLSSCPKGHFKCMNELKIENIEWQN